MGYKILVVDDDKEIVAMLEKKLLKEGYSVVVSFDGEEALLKVEQEDPDIILLDLTLPKLNGFEVLKEVRERFKDKWRPVIILSGQSDLEAVRQCYNMEADHYLTKPCSMEDILRGIRIMLSLIPLRKNE